MIDSPHRLLLRIIVPSFKFCTVRGEGTRFVPHIPILLTPDTLRKPRLGVLPPQHNTMTLHSPSTFPLMSHSQVPFLGDNGNVSCLHPHRYISAISTQLGRHCSNPPLNSPRIFTQTQFFQHLPRPRQRSFLTKHGPTFSIFISTHRPYPLMGQPGVAPCVLFPRISTKPLPRTSCHDKYFGPSSQFPPNHSAWPSIRKAPGAAT